MKKTLTDAWVTLYSPRWPSKGKNENDSWLDISIKIKINDGIIYGGETQVLDHSLISPGNSISPHIVIKDSDKIETSNISEVSLSIGYIKKDYLIDLQEDKWAVRAELVLVFGNEVLSTGYNDPVAELNFTDVRRIWEPKPNPRYFNQLFNFITISEQSKD